MSAANEGYLVGSNSLNFEKGTVSADLIHNSDFRINSKDHGSRRGENDLWVMSILFAEEPRGSRAYLRSTQASEPKFIHGTRTRQCRS